MRRPPRPISAAAILALALSPLVAVAAPASADDTPIPGRATLMGSLMSELGCPADWDEACAATDLAPTGTPGVFSLERQVPAGSYEFKVRLDGSWDENYGAGGVLNGPNAPLVLAGPATLRFTYDHTTHVTTVTPTAPAAGVTAADKSLAGSSLRKDLTRERFYFVMADRFANGSTANDKGGLGDDPLVSGYDPTAKGFYHGGDLRGIIDKLDYIKGTGTTSIWMTPSFKNRPVQGTGADTSAGYHGYWITDFTQIDPHLGTNAELKELIDKAHAKGMKVFFDIITNHTADVISYAEGQNAYIPKSSEPYKDANGNVFDDSPLAAGDTFPAIDPATSFPYTPVFPNAADATVKVPSWLNDPRLYHNRGNAAFDGSEGDLYGDFVGLDDLWTEQPQVRDGMIDIYKTWAEFGIDGFRIDTVKHVNTEFWQKFSPEVLSAAKAAGRPDFFMFGEVYDADPAKMSKFTTEGGLQATLDFGFQSRVTGFGNGRATSELRDLFAADDYYTDADSNAYSLPTFLGNHDMGRIGKFLSDGGATGTALQQRDEMVHSLMYLTRGQPVVYYGDEQGFVGDGGDQLARQTLFASKVDVYNDDDLIGTDSTTAVDNYNTKHPLYTKLAALAKLRDKHTTLADGAQIHRYSSSKPGIYAFSRIDAKQQVEYVVAANNTDAAKTATFDTFSGHMQYWNITPGGVTGKNRLVVSNREGNVTVTVPARGVLVYRAASPIKKSKAAPAVAFRTPAAGGVVHDRAEVGVSVPSAGFNQVTLAWRPVGTTAWTALGTDDNAPYRVFHDVRGLAKGTMVEYRAVLKDNAGHLSVAQTYGTVGDAPATGGGGGGPVGPVVQPASVSIPGDHGSELGCAADWAPDCAAIDLTRDADDDVWKGTFTPPAGGFVFKAAIDDAWTENYGAGAVRDGGNIGYTATGAPVTFYYDHGTHWATNDAIAPIATAAGSFQTELGCASDWDPECLRSWLQDVDGDGVYTFVTDKLPAGSYETKATVDLSFDENYGVGGTPGGSNIGFSVPAEGLVTTFSFDNTSKVLSVTSASPVARPDLSKTNAVWPSREVVAWDAVPGAVSYRLHWTATANGLAVDDESITGGTSIPLALDPKGLPAKVVAAEPALAGRAALRLDSRDYWQVWKIARAGRTGQVAVGAYDDLGRLIAATTVAVRPAVRV